MLFIAYTGRVIGIISQPESKTIIHHVTNCWCWVGREREGTQNYCKECLKYWQHSHTHSWTFILLSCCNKVGMITEIISWLIGTFFPHREMKKCHGSLCVYILWVVGRYLDSVCVFVSLGNQSLSHVSGHFSLRYSTEWECSFIYRLASRGNNKCPKRTGMWYMYLSPTLYSAINRLACPGRARRSYMTWARSAKVISHIYRSRARKCPRAIDAFMGRTQWGL